MRKVTSYSVTLETDVVENSLKKLKVGQKLSPIINALLKSWLDGKIELEVKEE